MNNKIKQFIQLGLDRKNLTDMFQFYDNISLRRKQKIGAYLYEQSLIDDSYRRDVLVFEMKR